ncbi:MAG: DUF1616 domain-containing protein [Thermoplasmata archaeon]|nr:DUF1616 domain-containing protein [Thermoplasmata archaeon]
MTVNLAFAVGGLLLLFFLPGFAVTRALFPEQRVVRPRSIRTLVEQVTLSVFVSLALTVLVGFALLGTSGGFGAAPSDPLVELALVAVTVVALVTAVLRGSFSAVPPATVSTEEPGNEGALELVRALDDLAREERRLRHRMRGAPGDSLEHAKVAAELETVRDEATRLRARREAEYAA